MLSLKNSARSVFIKPFIKQTKAGDESDDILVRDLNTAQL